MGRTVRMSTCHRHDSPSTMRFRGPREGHGDRPNTWSKMRERHTRQRVLRLNAVADLALPRLHPATPRAESPSRFLIPTAPAVTLHQSIATFDSPGKSRSVNPTGLSHLLLPVTLYITFGTGSYYILDCPGNKD